MSNTIEEEIIKNKFPASISNLTHILIFLFLVIIIILFNYNFTTYYKNQGIITKINNNYYLKIKILNKDLSFLTNKNSIIIDKKIYNYNIKCIQNKLLINNKNNYRYIYLNIDLEDKYRIENYLIYFKVEKETKKIYKYIIDLIGGTK